jgi:hypothetical protein
MGLLTAMILIFTATHSWARMPFTSLPLPESHISKTNFIPAQEGLRDLRIPLNMLAATPKIEFVDANGKVLDHCSGSQVSDDGTLLTAGHCVEQCLRKANAIKIVGGISVVDRALLSSARCLVRINGRISQASVLASNDCRGKDRFREGSANVTCNGLDFAILKTDDPSLRDQPCFHISSRLPVAGTGVAAIGYPPPTSREIYKSKARDSDGEGPFLTPGQTISYQEHCRTDVDKNEKPRNLKPEDPLQRAAIKRHVVGGHVLQTTTDVLRGVSGAGLVDTNTYSLLGVARSYAGNTANVECIGSGYYTSTASVVAALNRDYPELNLMQTFRCENNAFAPQNETIIPGQVPQNKNRPAQSQISR